MFRGQVTILRGNPQVKRVMTWGLLGLPVLAGIILIVPESAQKALSGVFIAIYAGVYTTLITRALQPLREVVDLHADPRGLFAGGRWLVVREDILEAYLRPAIAPSNVKGVQLSAWPMTVELVTTRGQLNLDAGDEPRTAQILTALGFPPVMVAANHIANTPENARYRR